MSPTIFREGGFALLSLDVIVRCAAAISGLVALAAYHRFALKIGVSYDLLILALSLVMFLCAARPLRPSRRWMSIFSFVAAVVVLYLCFRLLGTDFHPDADVENGMVYFGINVLIMIWSGAAAWLTRK